MLSIEDLDRVEDKMENLTQINFYPNPVKEYLIIENKRLEQNIIQLKLCNKFGEIVKEIELKDREIVDVSCLPKGVYLLKAKNFPVLVRKIVILD